MLVKNLAILAFCVTLVAVCGSCSADRSQPADPGEAGLGEGRGICLATSTDDMLDKWTKSPHNPVILQTGHGLAQNGSIGLGVVGYFHGMAGDF